MMDTQDLQHEFVKKAIAWVLADRVCDEHMATVDRLQRKIDAHLRGSQPASERDRELLKQLEYEKIGFTLACERESACGEEMRAAARVLVDQLEKLPVDPTIRVLHVLSAGHALCAFSLEVPGKWPAGHQWTSIAELREGVTKIEDLSCAACAASVRALIKTAGPLGGDDHHPILIKTATPPRRPDDHHPNLVRGTKVRAACRRSGKPDYTDLAIQERAQHDGHVGTVVDHSDSHGLCYEVRFESGTAWFDPEELTPV